MHCHLFIIIIKKYISKVTSTKYLEYISGKNCSTSTTTIPINVLFLCCDKNSYLKSLFFLSTPLLVLTITSNIPSRKHFTHRQKTKVKKKSKCTAIASCPLIEQALFECSQKVLFGHTMQRYIISTNASLEIRRSSPFLLSLFQGFSSFV